MAPAEPRSAGSSEPLVVLLHGLWCNRFVMQALAYRLRRCGFRVARFGYASVRRSPAQNAAALAHWLQEQRAHTVHYVAHSLGGLILCHLFAHFPQQAPGRVVLLGTPLHGSRNAARIAGLPGGRAVLGLSVQDGLLGGAPAWPPAREIGAVAGTVGVGMGLLLGGLGAPGDGAVAVSETCGPELTDHVRVRTSHTGLLFSPAVGRQVCAFLRHGKFLH